MAFVIALSVLAAAGALLTSVQVLLTARLLRRSRNGAAAVPATEPRVSILKPLCGLEDDLEENLASFACLDPARYEVILSVESAEDPALGVVEAVRRRFPDAPFAVVAGVVPARGGRNPKVARLIAAAEHAKGDVLLISDANVHVSPGDVERTVALLGDPAIGCVSNLFVGDGARSFGAVVESLHLLTFVLPGAASAAALDIPCVVGKSMAISRRAYEDIGGFAAFANVLAEDQAIGLAVRRAGYRLAVAPSVVRNVTVRRPLARALDRQVRWGKIRYSLSPSLYTGELLLNPFALALVAVPAAALAVPAIVPFALGLAAGMALLRIGQAGLLARLTGAAVTPLQILAMPLKDVLQLVTQLAPYVSREVSWHGHRARLGPGTTLLPSRRAATALS